MVVRPARDVYFFAAGEAAIKIGVTTVAGAANGTPQESDWQAAIRQRHKKI